MKITDLKSLKEQNAALQAAIAAAIAPFGLTLERQSGSIDTRGGSLKLTISTTFLPEGVENKTELDQATWVRQAPMLGLPPEAFGKVIRVAGVEYTLVGLDPARPKNAVKLRRVRDGKPFGSTVETVQRALS